MATNKSSRDAMVFVAVLAGVAILVMSNMLADRKFGRIDLTEEKKYSTTQPFRNIVKRLDDTLTLTYYVSGQVPRWFEVQKRDMLDKLKEIETASGGRVVVKVVDPSSNKELREKLAGAMLDVQDVEKDEVKWSKLITAMELIYKDKPPILIPAIGMPEQVEYIIGSRIMELTLDKKPIIAVMAPPAAPAQMSHMGQRQQSSGFEWLQQGAWQAEDGKKFDVKPLEIGENSPLNPDTALLIVIRPRELSQRQVFEISKYLSSGGKVLLIASPFKLENQMGWRAEKQVTGLEEFLTGFGISFNPDFVCDHSNMRMPLEMNPFTGEVTKYARVPIFVKVLGENIDQQSVLTRLMPGLIMPFAAEIKIDSGVTSKLGLTPHVLARTSNQSWTLPFTEQFQPEKIQYDERTQAYTGSKNVFVQIEGQFPFYYEGRPVPPWVKADPKVLPLSDKKEEIATIQKKPGTLVICSSPDAFHQTYLTDRNIGQHMQQNPSLIVNMAETFSLGDDLVRIRAKRYEGRVIKSLTGSEHDNLRTILKIGLPGAVPVLLIIFALVRMFLRRSAQTRYERQYSQTIGPSSFSS